MRYVLTYDVSEDNVRSKVAATLAAYGDRIQKSVFDCTLDDKELAAVVARVEQIIDADHDAFHAFLVCGSCQTAIVTIGQAHSPEPTLCWII